MHILPEMIFDAPGRHAGGGAPTTSGSYVGIFAFRINYENGAWVKKEIRNYAGGAFSSAGARDGQHMGLRVYGRPDTDVVE